MQIGTGGVSTAVSQFAHDIGLLVDADILELGTKRSDPSFPTHHKVWNETADWTFADVEDGIDVHVVVDAHEMLEFGDDDFDAVVAVSVWEHLRRPWIAAEEVARVLKPGGIVYIATHQSFPIHGYPSDYFRFSDMALAGIFEDAGLETLDVCYSYPAKIIPPPEVTRWNKAAPVFLNVDLYARKPL